MDKFLKKEHDIEKSNSGYEQKLSARIQNLTAMRCKKRRILQCTNEEMRLKAAIAFSNLFTCNT